jgi:hypothetical protein
MKFKRYIRNTLMAIGRNTKEMVELASSSLVIFRQMEPCIPPIYSEESQSFIIKTATLSFEECIGSRKILSGESV